MKTFKTNETVTVDNYPYGRLKCTATFGLEFNPKRGYRSVFQTINPKTGRINKPKKSTYSPLIRMMQNDDGFVSYDHIRFDDLDKLQGNIDKVKKWWDTFTEEERKDVYALIYNELKVSSYGLIKWGGADKTKVLDHLKPFVKIAASGFKDGDIKHLDEIKPDNEYLESLKDPNYSPFKTTQLT